MRVAGMFSQRGVEVAGYLGVRAWGGGVLRARREGGRVSLRRDGHGWVFWFGGERIRGGGFAMVEVAATRRVHECSWEEADVVVEMERGNQDGMLVRL